MREMRAPLTLLATLLALAAGQAAHAHVTGVHTGFVATVSGISPQQPGLLAQVLGGHEKISVRNWTQATVVVFDEEGAVEVRLAPGETKAWADPRVSYSGPPPEKDGLVRKWEIRGEANGTPFTISGFLGYRAPPADHAEAAGSGGSGWPAWATAAVLAGGGLLALAALALPLMRRKGESEASGSSTGS
jgi:hypothetical protein